MNIIQENTEVKLTSALQILDESNAEEKNVLHIRGMTFDDKQISTIPQLVEKWIGTQGAQIFICDDKDIFIISPNLSSKLCAQFKANFYAQFPLHEKNKKQLLSFYNMDNSGLALVELVELKIKVKKEKSAEAVQIKEAQKQENRKENFFNLEPNKNLQDTIESRRQDRAEIEILIVEDDAFSRRLISVALNQFKVIFAEDGQQALAAYLQNAPDIMFLDIGLPDVSGQDVLKKTLSFDPNAYIVMLSGNSQSDNVMAAIKSGAKGFVGKPFTKDKLMQYINKCEKKQPEKMKA